MTDPTRPDAPEVDELDLAADLPTGTVVLEASAGTGKTYAIAALVTRAVAEGRCELPELLVVTFTRAATAELRDRVRRRLVEAERHLRAVLAGTPPATDAQDRVLAHLARGAADELEARRRRLATAVTDFDAATIATIHGFTQQVLRSVGLAADVPRELTVLEDESALVDEVTDDVYVRRYLGAAAREGRPTREQAATIARVVAANPDADLRPDRDDPDPGGAERAALAHDLRAELLARKRRDDTLSYDDLLVALRDALVDPARGDAAVAGLRARYRWALIDEFQDTDPVQWQILERAFGGGDDLDGRALVLIGDPKQAIYSFRGADVRAYLEATERADQRRSLATNYRSDGPLLGALDRLLTGTRFGDAGITFAPVRAADHHRDGRLEDGADPAALQLRTYTPPRGAGNAQAVRQRFGEDVVAVLLDQLDRVRIGSDGRPLQPEDVAVLVRSNAEARLVQQCLRDARIPSVVNGVGSVLATDAADDWRWLLEAVERSSDPGRIRRLALSCWIGWDAARLGDASDDDLDELHEAAHRWAHVLADHGVASLERTVLAERDVAARLLHTVGGERHLTDVRHLGELLHTAERDDDRGISSLRAWLQTARAEAGDTPTPADEQARRLESDAAAVQILTIHRSKGLQYPVVLAPFLWGTSQGVQAPLVAHDPDTRRRVIDVGPSDRPGFDELKDVAQRESVGEQLRLLYVALTRAQHRAVVWWCATDRSRSSALARVLFGRGVDGQVELDDRPDVPKDPDEAAAHLRGWFEGTATSLATVPPPDQATTGTWSSDRLVAADLDAARIERTLDRAWRRTSYSAIVRRATNHDDGGGADAAATVTTEPDVEATDDEPDAPTDGLRPDGLRPDELPPATDTGDVEGEPLPLGELRGGTAFGTLVHAVLEHTDFAASDLSGHLDEVLDDQRPRHRVPGLTTATSPVLREGLIAAVRSPLGPLAGRHDGRWRTLADVVRADRLDELEFELPLAGGDAGRRGGDAVSLSALADLLERPAAAGGLADDDPLRLAGYPDRLRAPGYALDLRGYLNGSIDLVLRVHDADGQPRYLVADHKTNRLGGATATTADYHPGRLVDAMIDHDYPLQALLYQVALHRFLRWRQPGYDPAVHLGGALYLFLRGMVGPDTPLAGDAPYGVFAWAPPATVVTGLSDLLDGVRDPAAAEVPA